MDPLRPAVGARPSAHEVNGRARCRVVIGYGNELRGDDALGPLIARRLGRHALPDTTLMVCHQLTPELAEELEGCDRVIFVDASVRRDEEPVGVRELQPVANLSPGHHYTPEMLLALAASLHGVVPEAFLVQIRGYCFDFGAGISDAAMRHMDTATTAVLALLGVHEPCDA